jgi:aspartate oxidase
MTDIERHRFDVVIIGAGGAGLRAAIEARERGKKTAIISKSLFGKAHTVMAEGGIAASMGNVNPNDNWQVHYRDTMRGGKFLNNWRMAELHAKEAPARVWELETYGALFDRTTGGKISQRNFGGHTYPRLAHVGDRTGLLQADDLTKMVTANADPHAVAQFCGNLGPCRTGRPGRAPSPLVPHPDRTPARRTLLARTRGADRRYRGPRRRPGRSHHARTRP